MFAVCSIQFRYQIQVALIIMTCWTHTQGDIMLEWTPWKCACYPGWEPASQWRGPVSLMIPAYSLSRWRCLLCFGTVVQQYATTLLCWSQFKPPFLLSSGFCREGQKDQGALCLPWQWNAQVGQWTVLHSPAVGSCQNRVSLSLVRPKKQMLECNEMWWTRMTMTLTW